MNDDSSDRGYDSDCCLWAAGAVGTLVPRVKCFRSNCSVGPVPRYGKVFSLSMKVFLSIGYPLMVK